MTKTQGSHNTSVPHANIRAPFYLIMMLICSFSCENLDKTEFVSDFNSTEKRNWIGEEYWSNPLQDWHIQNGELECLVSKENRNVHILTKNLDSLGSDFTMSVDLKVYHFPTSENQKNWIGFSIGSKGEFNDFRDNAVFGKGLNMGITTNGNLFIDSIGPTNDPNPKIQKYLKEGARLQLKFTSEGSNPKIHLSLFNQSENEPLLETFQYDAKPSRLVGDLVLISDYYLDRKDPKRHDKSAAFKDWRISGNKISSHPDRSFGPILFSQYTLSEETLTLTAQMAPIIIGKDHVSLQIKRNKQWSTIQSSPIDPDARTANFEISDWIEKEDVSYRLKYKIDNNTLHYWEGTIRKDPLQKEELVIAGFTGNDHLGFPNNDIVSQIIFHNPDLLFFSGDQLYEPTGGYGVQRSPHDKACLDYLRKWYMFGWAFRDIMKDRPTVCITDDHDVFHGNIWGAGGIATPSDFGQGAKAQDAGGYKMPPKWVQMVEKTQTSHLPAPYDSSTIAQGLTTYYTDIEYGGISFAILEDRKFKSAPKALLPEADIWNGWAQNKNFDMKKNGDVSKASLLGEKQLEFLEEWSADWATQTNMKIVLSQTIFANVATLPSGALSGAIIPTLRIMNKDDYAEDDRPVADLDSNGWPQNGRNKAIQKIRKGFAVHLAGDQHLGSTIQYGVEEWNDSNFALCVPSISNHWPRRWYPSEGGNNRDEHQPKYTGEFEDGFSNKMTVHAVSNPTFTNKKPSKLHDRATGYGIVRMQKDSRNIIFECWPRFAKPELGDQEQYDGWPIRIAQEDNYKRTIAGYLPTIEVQGFDNPVIQVYDETMDEILYTLRIKGDRYSPKIFDLDHVYSIKVGKSSNRWISIKNYDIISADLKNENVIIRFED